VPGHIHIQLVTLHGMKLEEDVYEVILPTLEGEIGVLPGHMPLVSVAVPGVISVRLVANDRDDQMQDYEISGGVIEVDSDNLRVLVDEADHSDEINEQEAQKAFIEAQELYEHAANRIELQRAQELIDRQAVRIQVANVRRRHKRHTV